MAASRSCSTLLSYTRSIHPILPVAGERNVLITSALPYVNNVPHLGNIIGSVLSADVFARYCRQRRYNTLYVCGVDEYGTATETKALQESCTPQLICDKYYAIHDAIYKWFNIHFDIFGRTSNSHQTKIAQDVFWKLYENKFISKSKMDQLHCHKCNRFLADRFVEGVCPYCSYNDARGDQCDNCGHLINAVDLKSPRCKICSSKPSIESSSHLFLDLTKLQEKVNDWFVKSSQKGPWSNNAISITNSLLRDGLKSRCITRDLRWGTPVPLTGYTNKVFYVWFDAPIGYMSITACYTDQWKEWWMNPNGVELYQFMAKDNVPFHSIMFPASLIGTGSDYTLAKCISSTEYLNFENDKFSKSRQVGIFGDDAVTSGISSDIYRFYLLLIRPETQDTSFHWNDFIIKVNSELVNNIGNFIYRTLTFTKNNHNSQVPIVTITNKDSQLMDEINNELKQYIDLMEGMKLRDALKCVLKISQIGNMYLQSNEPWKTIKYDSQRAGTVIGLCLNIVHVISVIISPYMPMTSSDIMHQLNVVNDDCYSDVINDAMMSSLILQPGHVIGEPHLLFAKLQDSFVDNKN